MTILLVIAYLSAQGVPTIETHVRDNMNECNSEAKAWYDKIKVGSGRAWCKRVVASNEKRVVK